jgi:phage terminase large subunit-like protein
VDATALSRLEQLKAILPAAAEAHQTPPPDPWTTWLFLGGRGAGKTFAGAAWIAEQAALGANLALVGPTFHDVREVMIEGPSGIRSLYPAGQRPKWQASRRRLEFGNGAVAQAFSAEDPDSLRGPQFHAAWADEFCAWPRPAETLAMLRFGLRLGTDPRLVVTSTPKPSWALKALMARCCPAAPIWSVSAGRRSFARSLREALSRLETEACR